MYIPSYDDLTPSIPDITPRETLDVSRLVPASASEASRHCATLETSEREGGPLTARATPVSGLFACLRSRRSPNAILSIARDFSPRLERHGPSAVVFDVSGLGGLIGEPQAIAAEIERAAAPHHGVSIAIASTQVAAMLLALARPSVSVVTGEPAGALAPLGLAVLRQFVEEAGPPAGLAVFDVLRRWGLQTIGELAALPAADLSARLGQAGVAVRRLARGIDPAPLVPDPGVPRFVQSMELEWPIDALEPLSFVFARLLDPLSSALARADRGAAALRLDLRLADRTTHARVLPLPAAMRDPRVLRTLLLLDLEGHPPAAAIDVVTIEADPAPGRIVQYSLLERATPSPETLATLTARLGALVGESRCGSPALVDTHRPDGFKMRAFDLPKRVAVPLFAPERGTAPLLRRFRPPVAVRVAVNGGRPVRVEIDRKGMPGGRIEQAAGPWRTSGEWWCPDATHWDRDEWDVAFNDGSLCRIFRDRTTGRWFIEGVID